DVRTCTFITKDSAGNYSFRHRSFLEYFCTQSILDEIRTKQTGLLSERPISTELMAFWRKTALQEEDFAVLQEWSGRTRESILARNAAAILSWHQQPIKSADAAELGTQVKLSSTPEDLENYILQRSDL